MAVKKQFESFFKKMDRDIEFVYNGKEPFTFTKYNDTSVVDTRVKLISGLNHFLRFVYDYRSEEDAEYVNTWIMATYFKCIKEAKRINSSFGLGKGIAKEIEKVIIDLCSINDEYLLSIVADYVTKTIDMNIVEAAATTDISITNTQAKCLTLIGVLIKFSYLISSMLRCDMTFNETLTMFMDKLSMNAFAAYLKNNGEDYSNESIDIISTEIDEYVFKIVGYHWNRTANSSYKDKFKSVGIDQMSSARKNKMDIYSALKKYIPVCVDEEAGRRYIPNPAVSIKTVMRELYWTSDKRFEDFKNKNLALTGYIQRTVKNVVLSQDLNKPFAQDINVTDILVNANEESSLRRDNSLYEDKEAHLLEIRQGAAKVLFKMFVQEVIKYDFDLREELPLFNVNSNHPFNNFILSKILLSLTGEQRVYKEFFGNFSKILLALFYIRVKDTNIFPELCELIDIMKCPGKPNNEIYSLDTIEMYLKLNDINVNPSLYKSILGVYTKSDGVSLILRAEVFGDLFKFLDSPANVRTFLFPDKYKGMKDPEKPTLKKYTDINYDYADSLRQLVTKGVY